MAADSQHPTYFVPYPEYFLQMLEYLVGNDQIEAVVREWQRLALDIDRVDNIELLPKALRIHAFHRDRCDRRVSGPYQLKIAPAPAPRSMTLSGGSISFRKA